MERKLTPRCPCSCATQFLVIFYIGGVLYCLLGFAVVCEEYFVASLLILGEKFHLSDDVNGERDHTTHKGATVATGLRHTTRC
jgi:hypothetical protein